jgi:lysophospholipase L1-like esterase
MSSKTHLIPFVLVIFAGALMAKEEQGASSGGIRYVAIGDSYSIGEGAKKDEAWPALLAKHLREKGVKIELIANPSVTGWTTEQAILQEYPVFVKAKPNFATLQIGVNDWVQGVNDEIFRTHLTILMDQMLDVLHDKQRLLIINIPDFGVTPTGPRYARGRNISEGIAFFNKIISEESAKRGLRVVDVFALSQQMGKDRSLVAADGLHPSAKEYAEWEKVIFPVALGVLRK